ncbi:MAG: gstF [Herminiimonas sp.]|nr:gstF [Herminiimonas sp.]
MSDSLKLQITKIIKSKRARVFEAWTNADLMKQWLAPGELISPSAKSEPKVGGSFTLQMEGMMRGSFTKGVASGIYKQIIPNELVVLTWNWVGDYQPPETLITVTFKDVEGGTEITLTQEGFADEQHKGGYAGGWQSAFEKLSKALN